jgi:CCR4-NOT transcriptional regulation complex NOT5 subunit
MLQYVSLSCEENSKYFQDKIFYSFEANDKLDFVDETTNIYDNYKRELTCPSVGCLAWLILGS